MPLNLPAFRIPTSEFNEYAATQLIRELHTVYQGKKTTLCFHYVISIVLESDDIKPEDFFRKLFQHGYSDHGYELRHRRQNELAYRIIGRESILSFDEFWKDYEQLKVICEEFGCEILFIEPDWPG